MAIANPRQFLRALFQEAVDAVSAQKCLPSYLPQPPVGGKTIVIGAGKGAAAMAKAVEDNWSGDISGLVVTRYGHGAPCKKIEVIEAAHPVPDAAGRDAAKRMLSMVKGLSEKDLVICLISGGGSALLALPAKAITLEQKQQVNRQLLRSGANIAEMNCVRKHLSDIKGGRLALACAPAKVVTLMISDIPGDDPTVIASGPTLPDDTTCADALSILKKYELNIPDTVLNHLQSGAGETPKSGDVRFARNESHIIATAQQALQAAANYAKAQGVTPYILSDCIEGESRDIALMHASLAKQITARNQPFAKPCLLISGGETTVTVKGNGRGGRNAEFLLSFALAANGLNNVYAIACDTDGIDGSEDNAGAIYEPGDIEKAAQKGVNAKALLANNDGYSFFNSLNQLIVTQPTRTNVNDFRAILIL